MSASQEAGETTDTFGWSYNDGDYSPCYVNWPVGTPTDTMERLKVAGFDQAPVLNGGRGIGVHVYARDIAMPNTFHLRHPRGQAQYAVVVQRNNWQSGPIFADAFPNLLGILKELEPLVRLFNA